MVKLDSLTVFNFQTIILKNGSDIHLSVRGINKFSYI